MIKSKEEVSEMIDDHWQYVKDVLISGQSPFVKSPSYMDIIEFHYKSGMIHGYKHGIQDAEK